MVKPNNDKPNINPDELLETLFLPDNLRSLREQHKRYARIQAAQGKKDEIGVIGYLNTALILGLSVAAMKLIEQENELGI